MRFKLLLILNIVAKDMQRIKKAIDYAFLVLNLHKIYLFVDVQNEKQFISIKAKILLSKVHYKNTLYTEENIVIVISWVYLKRIGLTLENS